MGDLQDTLHLTMAFHCARKHTFSVFLSISPKGFEQTDLHVQINVSLAAGSLSGVWNWKLSIFASFFSAVNCNFMFHKVWPNKRLHGGNENQKKWCTTHLSLKKKRQTQIFPQNFCRLITYWMVSFCSGHSRRCSLALKTMPPAPCRFLQILFRPFFRFLKVFLDIQNCKWIQIRCMKAW